MAQRDDKVAGGQDLSGDGANWKAIAKRRRAALRDLAWWLPAGEAMLTDEEEKALESDARASSEQGKQEK